MRPSFLRCQHKDTQGDTQGDTHAHHISSHTNALRGRTFGIFGQFQYDFATEAVKKAKKPKPDKGNGETQPERDRRLLRECKGRPNAGACEGYAS